MAGLPSGTREPALAADAATDPSWYKDAVVYQLHIKAFFDANDDGIGDFRGLTDKLDYVKDLGVNTVWLLRSTVAAARRRLRRRRLPQLATRPGRAPISSVRARGAPPACA